MQRLSAYFALSVIWVGALSPFFAAAQMSPVPACCRRNGMHRCGMYAAPSKDSGKAGFHAPRPHCPYSTPAPVATLNALEFSKFDLSAPVSDGFIASAGFDHPYAADLDEQSARGPPLSLL